MFSDFNSTFNGGGGFSSSTQSAPGGAPRRPDQHLISVTASMIHEQLPQSEVVMIGAYEFSRLKLVGVIRKVQRETMYVMYDIDDGTGPPVKVRQWSDAVKSYFIIVKLNFSIFLPLYRKQ